MLEVLLETYGAMCTALVDFEKARLFLMQLGRIDEVHDVWDEVPGRHDQGGDRRCGCSATWTTTANGTCGTSPKRSSRSGGAPVRDPHPGRAGEAHQELERDLHEYLRRRVRARRAAMMATTEEVRARTLEVEEELERTAERDAVARLGRRGRRRRGVTGLDDTLAHSRRGVSGSSWSVSTSERRERAARRAVASRRP